MSARRARDLLLPATQDGPLVVVRSAFWHFNAIGFWDGASACVIDAGIYPHEIDALRSVVTNAGERKVETVVVTHSHHDHIRGWKRFPGARVVMPRVAAEKDETARARILAAKATIDRKLDIVDEDFAYPRADTVFDESLTLTVGDAELELVFLPGHSNCCSFVWIPSVKTVCSADYLVSPGLPYCRWQAAAFEQAMRELRTFCEERDVQRIVPAHNDLISGTAAILAAIDTELDYFAFVRAEVDAALARGASQQHAVRSVAKRVAERRGRDLGGKERQDMDNIRRVLAEVG